MIDQQKIVDLVYKVVDGLNETLPEGERIEKSLDTVLSGPSEALDSMSLVNLVVEAEQQIEDELGVVVNLTDQSSISTDQNPLASLGSLVEYIGSELAKEADT